MSFIAFVAGVAVGGLRYGTVKYQLLERESIVIYSINQVKDKFNGDHLKTRGKRHYEPFHSREHEYYKYVREGWNSKVLAFRSKMYEVFDAEKD